MNAEPRNDFSDDLVREVLEGRMTRRELVQRAAAVGLSLTALGPLLAACGGSTSSTTSASTAASGTPKRGGSLTYAYQGEPESLDPAIFWVLPNVVIPCISEGFYYYQFKPGKAGQQLQPILAEAMPSITNGGKTFTIPLKKGVKFQAPVSREVTAEDFKYSFERMMKYPRCPGTYFYTGVAGATEYQAGKAANVSGFKVLDKYTIEIDLVAPDMAFLYKLAEQFCAVVPKEWVAKWGNREFGRHPLGTGPFLFDHWTPGREIVLKRNPDYHDAEQVWLDECTVLISISPEVALLKLQRGEVDILGSYLPPADIDRIMNDPTWRNYVYQAPSISNSYVALNAQMAPFDNVTVRQAISWAIDRDKQVQLLGGPGLATALYQVYPPGLPGYQPDKKWYGYDPAKAKQLLSEAGFPNGFETTLVSENDDPYPKLCQAVQNDLAAVGVKANLKLMDVGVEQTYAATPKKAPMCLSGWVLDYPDPSDWIGPMYTKAAAVPGGQNWAWWWHPKVEQMYAQASAMTDPQARLAKFEDMQAFIATQAPYVQLTSSLVTTMCSKNVGGFYLHQLWIVFDLWKYWRK